MIIMIPIYAITWNFRDTPEGFDKIVNNDYNYFESLCKKSSIDEFVILITCNRVEIYAYTRNEIDKDLFKDSLIYNYPESTMHLLRVASGLESMSIGENDIMRQVKEAYELSIKRKTSGKILSYIFKKALNVGKEVRTQTSISRGKTSIPAISLDICDNEYGINNKSILIIGNGKMATDFSRYLKEYRPGNVTIAGRSIDHARNLAVLYGYSYDSIKNLNNLIKNSDIIIAATSAGNYIVKDLGDLARNKYFIDISKPENIDPEISKYARLLSINEIGKILKRNEDEKKGEVEIAEVIINQEQKTIDEKLKEMMLDDVIAMFYKFANNVKKDELEELFLIQDFNDEQKKDIDAMTSSLINKILAPYTNSVKQFIKENKNFDYILNEYKKMLEQFMENIVKKL
ncbi:glutamyl-tRNA reductase [Picrophilus oshimae DSM 9789]|uniref:Glutamyl-tRNA reductase n=2 Tax=Picrophilus oshimae TaxID=46632 RepID=HEM1_PICTO|nr:RecName: Full=Glutamyl-tRNA reductase; Short=GluTR [Picrophilus oshimae DSM 9789]AAT43503.1 glutamyl-tRNA reductase [Picrophilus oshimae DSM 9789]